MLVRRFIGPVALALGVVSTLAATGASAATTTTTVSPLQLTVTRQTPTTGVNSSDTWYSSTQVPAADTTKAGSSVTVSLSPKNGLSLDCGSLHYTYAKAGTTYSFRPASLSCTSSTLTTSFSVSSNMTGQVPQITGWGAGAGGTLAGTVAVAGQSATSSVTLSSAASTTSTTTTTTPVDSAASVAVGASGSSSRIFASNSFWYQQIPTNVTLNSQSSTYVKNLLSDISSTSAGYNSTSYTPPIYTVAANTPRVSVKDDLCEGAGSDPAWTASNWQSQFSSVPIPAGAKASSGADGEIVIYSPSTNEVWELWHFASSSSGYSACWGGKIANANASTGVFAYPFGVAASGLSELGGTVRISELQAGHIDHAIEIGVNRPRSGVYSWPANRTDGSWSSTDAIPEGLRLRLDPSVNVDSLNLNPIGKMIAVAAQKYGFVVRDNTFGPLVVYGENAAPYVAATGKDPYTTVTSAPYYQWLVGFPWSKLQALPMDYGKS